MRGPCNSQRSILTGFWFCENNPVYTFNQWYLFTTFQQKVYKAVYRENKINSYFKCLIVLKPLEKMENDRALGKVRALNNLSFTHILFC